MKKYIVKLKKYVFLEIICSLCYTVCIGFIPIIIKWMLDANRGLTLDRVIFLISLYFGSALLAMVLQYFSQKNGWKVRTEFQKNLRLDLMSKILDHDYQKFKEHNQNDYVTILTNNVNVISEQYVEKVVDIIKSVFMVIIYAVYMFVFLDAYVAVVIIFCSMLALFLPKLTGNKLSDKRADHTDSLAKLTSKIIDILSGFSMTNYKTKAGVMEFYKTDLNAAEDKQFQYGKFKSFSITLNGFILYSLDISAFSISAFLLLTKRITIGTATASLSYIKEFVWPIRYIIDDINDINASKKVIENIKKILDKKETQLPVNCNGSQLILDNTSVSYDNFSINNFTYTFKPNSITAIIGSNGSGKSTIFDFITKQVIPHKGRVLIGANEIYNIDTSCLISGVYRGHHIYQTNFYDNVTMFGSFNADGYRGIENVIRELDMDKINDIKDCKDCSKLSDGEKQLVLLLRTLLANTPIILLDEAFSAIDANNKILIQNKFLSLKNKTLILITHDISEETLKQYDTVIKLKNGSIEIL